MTTDWKLERTISLGDVVLLLSLAFGGVGYITYQEQRQVKAETEAADIKTLNDSRFAAIDADLERVRQQQQRMEVKLDTILEDRRR
jgi:hypothetical protein